MLCRLLPVIPLGLMNSYTKILLWSIGFSAVGACGWGAAAGLMSGLVGLVGGAICGAVSGAIAGAFLTAIGWTDFFVDMFRSLPNG